MSCFVTSFAPNITGIALFLLVLKNANNRFHMAYMSSFRKIGPLVVRLAPACLPGQMRLSERCQRQRTQTSPRVRQWADSRAITRGMQTNAYLLLNLFILKLSSVNDQMGLATPPTHDQLILTSNWCGSGCPLRTRCNRSSRLRILSISRLKCAS